VGHVVVVSLFWVPLNSISSIVCWKNQPRFNSINICMIHQGRTGCSQTKCYVHCEVFGSALRFWTLKHLWCTSAKLSQTRCNYWITHLDHNWERALLQALCREIGHVKYYSVPLSYYQHFVNNWCFLVIIN
jgi:hypothetical protein